MSALELGQMSVVETRHLPSPGVVECGGVAELFLLVLCWEGLEKICVFDLLYMYIDICVCRDFK